MNNPENNTVEKDQVLTLAGLEQLIGLIKANFISSVEVINGQIQITKGDGTISYLPLDSSNTVYYSQDDSPEVNNEVSIDTTE